jgi:hypothetical protein
MDHQEHMRHRTVRPFTVEVKSRKKSLPQTPATFHDSNVGTQATSSLLSIFSNSSSRSAAEHDQLAYTIQEPSGRPLHTFTSASETQSKGVEGAERQAKRILPDLSWQEPVEVLLREHTEEQAIRRRQPRGPRKVTTKPATARAAKQRPENRMRQSNQAIDQEAVARNSPITVNGKDVPVPALVDPLVKAGARPRLANPILRRSLPARMRRRGSRWLDRRQAHWAAYRRARRHGVPVRLRAGERWKRRLPRACW